MIEYMAELADVSPAHIQRVETANKGISLPCLYRIADALHVYLEFLIEMDSITGSVNFSDEFLGQMSIQEISFWEDIISYCKQMIKKYNI